MRNSFRPALETLESREVPAASLAANGILTVRGTAAADQIVLQEYPESNLTAVILNGVQQNFLSSRITRIDVFGYAGNDVIDASGIISDVVREFGGNGNDRLVGGGQNDALYGENHNDVLIGGPGNDLMNGGYGVDTFFNGPNDRPIVDVGVRALGFDATDAPALAKPTYFLALGAPQMETHAYSTQPGQRTLAGFILYTPAFGPGTEYSVTVEGNFSGGTGLQIYRSEPNATDNVGILAPTSIRVNADGSRTLTFLTPVTIPSKAAMGFQVRGVLGSSGLPFDVRVRNIEVAGTALNVENKFQIHWNA